MFVTHQAGLATSWQLHHLTKKHLSKISSYCTHPKNCYSVQVLIAHLGENIMITAEDGREDVKVGFR